MQSAILSLINEFFKGLNSNLSLTKILKYQLFPSDENNILIEKLKTLRE